MIDDPLFDLDGVGVLSRSALLLHSWSAVWAVDAGRPRWVPDIDLPPEASVAVLELTASGLWVRGVGGYRIREDDPSTRYAIEAAARLDDAAGGDR